MVLAQVIATLAPTDNLEDAWALDVAYYTFELQRIEREIAALLKPEPEPSQAIVDVYPVEDEAIDAAGDWNRYQALSPGDREELTSLVKQRRAIEEEHHRRNKVEVKPLPVCADALAAMLLRHEPLLEQLTREIELCSRRRTASLRELERYRLVVRPGAAAEA